MKRAIIGLILLSLTAAVILAIYLAGSGQLAVSHDNQLPADGLSNDSPVILESPLAESIINSPVIISGQARGQWFFEASFPVKIIDAHNQVLGLASAQAQGDWMTDDFIPFKATVDFSQPTTSTGFIVLFKDNPSGLPEHDAEVKIPVKFSAATDVTAESQRTVKFYYYNAAQDLDEQGNISCGQSGLVAVNRQLPLSISPIKDTIQAFLSSPLTEADRAAGLASEFPLTGVSLVDLALRDGNLIIKLSDPYNKTSGGSCRVSILKQQLEAVARQFPEVQAVDLQPAELFQP
jgi:hypothetical protein